MADVDLEQSLEELESVKQAFKTNIDATNISTLGVEFRNMPNLVKQMEKKLPTQTKSVKPTTSEQNISADSGYKLTGVKVEAVNPSDYYKPETSLTVAPLEQDQTFAPSNNQVYNEVKVYAVPKNYIGSAVTKLESNTYTPTTTDIVIQNAQYLTGEQTIKGDANLVAENIADGVELFGVTGTHKGGGLPNLIEGSATTNGIYYARDEGADGYSSFVVNVATSGGGDLTDLDYIKYHDKMVQIEQGRELPTEEEYEEIISKGYKMLDYVFRGII